MSAPVDPSSVDPSPIDPVQFHRRLDAALDVDPAGSSPAADLAAGKRRLRRRRATWAAVAATAVVAVAVPSAVALSGLDGPFGRGPDTSPTTQEPAPTPARAGWRWESYREATFQVPESWGYGGVGAWCANGGSPDPAVRFPGQAERSIGCSGRAYGVEFAHESTYENNATPGLAHAEQQGRPGWRGFVAFGDLVVDVFTESRSLTQQVLETVRRIETEDPNGCAPALEMVRDLKREPVLHDLESVDSVAVCRYDVDSWPRGDELLAQSERLSGDDAGKLLAALRGTTSARSARVDCVSWRDGHGAEAVRLLLDGHPVWVNWDGDCQPHGLLDGTDVRTLTHDVVWWALSPGWTGEPPAVVSGGKGDAFQPRRLR